MGNCLCNLFEDNGIIWILIIALLIPVSYTHLTVNKKSLFCRLLAFLSGAVFGGGIVGILWLILH